MTNSGEVKAIDSFDLRRAFGSFATGVTIVTTADDSGEVYGFTANSFTSVSLDPPLLLVSMAKSAKGLPFFTSATGFAINILAEKQRELSNRFASAGADKFANTDWYAKDTGSPIFEGVIAWFDCESYEQVDAGDHVILIGKVLNYGYNSDTPLGFCRGAYVSYGLSPQMLQLVSSTGKLRVGAIIENDGKILLQTDVDSGDVRVPVSDSVGDANTPDSLLGMLADAGIEAHLPFLFSAYHFINTRFIYYRGELLSIKGVDETPSLRFFALEDIPWSSISDASVKRMLQRYESERSFGSHSVYIGGHNVGEVYSAD